MHRNSQLSQLLIELEQQLKALQCWDAVPPSAEALASSAPFAVDSLEFYQWLQWIFMPKMLELIDSQNVPMMPSSIALMAEEWLKIRPMEAGRLMQVLSELDKVLSGE